MSLSKYNTTTKELEPIAGGFDVQGILDDIGDLTELETTDKSDLVDAINEVNSGKVDKVAGKGLSTNDYDDTEKGKVADNTSAIEAIVNVNGCCNILPNNASTTTDVNVTFTVNSNKSVTVNGVPSSDFAKIAIVNNYLLKAGTYTLSDGVLDDVCPWLYLSLTNYTTSALITDTFDKPDGKSTFTLESDTYVSLVLAVYYSNPINNVTAFPMLYDARLNPSGYVPYAMTNGELTERVTVHKKVMTVDTTGGNKVGGIGLYDGDCIILSVVAIGNQAIIGSIYKHEYLCSLLDYITGQPVQTTKEITIYYIDK